MQYLVTLIMMINFSSLRKDQTGDSGDCLTDDFGNKYFECTECNKRFTNIANQKKHFKVVHLNIRDYICEICSKAKHRSAVVVLSTALALELLGSDLGLISMFSKLACALRNIFEINLNLTQMSVLIN